MAESNSQFVLDVTDFARRVDNGLSIAIRKIAFDLASRVIMRTPVKTGRARANWMVSTNAPNITATEDVDLTGNTSQGSALGAISEFNPAVDTDVYIVNSVPYIEDLEHGSSQQAPNGMVRLTVAEFLGIAQDAVSFARSQM